MVTGGSAVAFWGEVRTTADIDVVVQIAPSDIQSLVSSLKDEAYIDEEDVREAVSRKRMFNAIFNSTSFKVDFAVLDTGDRYEQEKFSRRRKLALADGPVWVIAPEDLVLSKLRWMKSAGGSERQLRDCRGIIALNGDKLDLDYMRKWAAALDLLEEFELLLPKGL
jgi:hypothetical protein